MTKYKSYKNKCIVLDLDETLVHSKFDNEIIKKNNLLKDPKYINLHNRLYTISLSDTYVWGITRPYLYYFLNFCFDYFNHVIIFNYLRELLTKLHWLYMLIKSLIIILIIFNKLLILC